MGTHLSLFNLLFYTLLSSFDKAFFKERALNLIEFQGKWPFGAVCPPSFSGCAETARLSARAWN